ncbi:MAG TPA: hypothetical protein VL490_10175 [Mucilaginibacter sp.]|jgi:hypothetical protein|nr:hypothetical protein [Mucilaginibacter sp.]
MKQYFKVGMALLAGVAIFSVSCKKNVSSTNTPTDKTAELAGAIAMGFSQSLSAGFSTSLGSDTKTAGTTTIRTMGTQQYACGQVVNTKTNKTDVLGDTTRTTQGNSIITYMCNGFFNNNVNVDAYTQVDTLTVTDKGSKFKNINTVFLNYDVRSADRNYIFFTVTGTTGVSTFTSKLNGTITTESRKIDIGYIWTNVAASRDTVTGKGNYTAGKVDFTVHVVDKSSATPADGIATDYSGFITLAPKVNFLYITFYLKNGGTKLYLVNTLTGEFIEQ